ARSLDLGHRWAQVLALLRDARRRSSELDVIALNTAIAACGRCGQWTLSSAILSWLRLQGLEPDAASCSAAISASSGVTWEQVLGVLRDMALLSVKRSDFTWG
ncbi:unnamed protein product, partial [Polarella glacialis]